MVNASPGTAAGYVVVWDVSLATGPKHSATNVIVWIVSTSIPTVRVNVVCTRRTGNVP